MNDPDLAIGTGDGDDGRGRVKRVFPGNNTAGGFFSFYDHIIGPDARRVLILKGGPGVGKSTFMAKIADAMLKENQDVELHLCSSDPDSLDAVVFPGIGVAMLDGTAPHMTDPKYPGAVDEIINLGDFWQESLIRANRTQIVQGTREARKHFARAYRFLAAAKSIYDDIEAVNADAMNFGLANKIADHLMHELFSGIHISPIVGRARHLFASAITPKGMVHFLPTVTGGAEHRYVIEGDPGTGKSKLLHKIAQGALERGYFAEMYHCALNPEKVEHVVVPQMSLALTKSIDPHVTSPGPRDRVIDMNECVSASAISRHTQLLREHWELYRRLLDGAFAALREAKNSHRAVEEFYLPAMDFAAVDVLCGRTLERIRKYAAQARASVNRSLGSP